MPEHCKRPGETDITLAPGQTVRIAIMPGLEYTVTHEGWVMDVTCSREMGVRPVSPTQLKVVCLDVRELEL